MTVPTEIQRMTLSAILLAVTSMVNYVAWVGWDQARDISSGEAPYDGWQWFVLAAGVIPLTTSISALVDWSPVSGSVVAFFGSLVAQVGAAPDN